MTHYVCTGDCHGESPRPGTCQAKDCGKFGEPLEPCECEDGLHMEVFEQNSAELENLEKADELEETDI
ncbi:MAG: hypothetical protein AAB738_02715 [Patescibacteria group bacterium]